MQRSQAINRLSYANFSNYKQKIAYHEAGHATAIYFNNRQKHLPPVFFQIIFKDLDEQLSNSKFKSQTDDYNCIAKVEGGRLIQVLPIELDNWRPQSLADKANNGLQYTDDYRLALETDIVNLLIGPLAEAKYVALMDNEPFHHQLLPAQALKYYGGEDDLTIVNEYLQSYYSDKQAQNRSLNQFLMQAFNFVNDKANWKAITCLADYIQSSHKKQITCEEVASILDGKQKH